MAPQVIRSILTSAGLIVLLPTRVLAQGPGKLPSFPTTTGSVSGSGWSFVVGAGSAW